VEVTKSWSLKVEGADWLEIRDFLDRKPPQLLFSRLHINNYKTPYETIMDTANLSPLVDDLETNIDDLEEVLKPLLDSPISATAARLSALDRAKLFVLVTYAIESLLFSHVRLTGADGKAHPVFTELQRVKQYFEKIEKAENPVGKRENLSLNKPAAGRFIKAALAGNIKFDEEREKVKMREAQAAKKKLEELNGRKKAEEKEVDSSSSSEEESSDTRETALVVDGKKRKRVKASDMMDDDAKPETKKGKKSKERGQAKHTRREARSEDAPAADANQKNKSNKKKTKMQKDGD
jgi:exosome complex protein LRP1